MVDINAEERLYLALASIPKGRVTSYGALAQSVGLHGRARWVGRIMSQLPSDTQLPWHRVINARRRISFPIHSEKFKSQLIRLRKEGIDVTDGGLVSKDAYWTLS